MMKRMNRIQNTLLAFACCAWAVLQLCGCTKDVGAVFRLMGEECAMAPASRAACFEAGTCYALWAISDDKWADPVLNYVLTQSDQYPFGEERRLFYVSVNYRKTNDLAASKKPIPPLFSCFFLPLLFRTRGRSSTRGQSTGLTFPRSVGRAFKPNSFMLQAALKSRSWCVPHLGQSVLS